MKHKSRCTFMRRVSPLAALEALEKNAKADPQAIAETKARLDTIFIRLFLGTADDADFSRLATYLLYGAVLAENFVGEGKEPYARAVLELRVAKKLLAHGTAVPRDFVDGIYRVFEVAREMVFSLTVGEQIRLRDYIEREGARLINTLQDEADVDRVLASLGFAHAPSEPQSARSLKKVLS